MRVMIPLAIAAFAAVPATASAATQPGLYSGVTSGKYIQVGQAEEPTDKGKVTFKVRSGKVRDFRVREQLFHCGMAAELRITVPTIALSAAGKGAATIKIDSVGTLKISIKVTAKGKASGTIVRPASAIGLCNPDYPVRFTAKKR